MARYFHGYYENHDIYSLPAVVSNIAKKFPNMKTMKLAKDEEEDYYNPEPEYFYTVPDRDIPKLRTTIAEAGLEAINEAKQRVSNPILLKREIIEINKLYDIAEFVPEYNCFLEKRPKSRFEYVFMKEKDIEYLFKCSKISVKTLSIEFKVTKSIVKEIAENIGVLGDEFIEDEREYEIWQDVDNPNSSYYEYEDFLDYCIEPKYIPQLKTAIAEAGFEAIKEAKQRVSNPLILKREVDEIIKLYNIADIIKEYSEILKIEQVAQVILLLTVENLTQDMIVIENKLREAIFIEAKKESVKEEK